MEAAESLAPRRLHAITCIIALPANFGQNMGALVGAAGLFTPVQSTFDTASFINWFFLNASSLIIDNPVFQNLYETMAYSLFGKKMEDLSLSSAKNIKKKTISIEKPFPFFKEVPKHNEPKKISCCRHIMLSSPFLNRFIYKPESN
ncbi:MAG: hypothetical protein WCP39_04280 [Chlamydiota bacterium]